MNAPKGSFALAWRLGLLGLLPFVALAIAAVAEPDAGQAIASRALLAYGATILSFVGGIYWGLAIARPVLSPRENALFLTIGVVPQLLGWVALMVPSPFGHFVSAAAFLALLAVDRAAVQSGIAPDWFTRLRWPLSCAAGIAMTIGAFGTSQCAATPTVKLRFRVIAAAAARCAWEDVRYPERSQGPACLFMPRRGDADRNACVRVAMLNGHSGLHCDRRQRANVGRRMENHDRRSRSIPTAGNAAGASTGRKNGSRPAPQPTTPNGVLDSIRSVA